MSKYYRFYGARHSNLHLGFKIDYEEENDTGNFLPRIRSISHLHQTWLLDNSKFFIWQQFIIFLQKHLLQTYHLDPFYFDLLDDISNKIHTQNPVRAILEGYLRILDFEGRFSYPLICTKCHETITSKVTFLKGLKPFHHQCLPQNRVFDIKELEKFLILKNSFFLEDETVNDLFSIVL